MQSKKHRAYKYQNDSFLEVEDNLVLEESLLINVNFKPFTLTMRTPGNEDELVRGLLFTENILAEKTPFNFSIVEKKNGIITAINVEIPENELNCEILDKRNLLSVSSCGICGKIEKNDFILGKAELEVHEKLSPEMLFSMFSKLENEQHLHQQTGGAHGVGAFSLKGDLLSVKEDIGRHNAVDKVIGFLILNNKLDKAKVLLVSGRISYEIITKAFMAKIPFLASVSAPSSLAVELAEELGITLLGFSREQRFTCYSNKENLSLKK